MYGIRGVVCGGHRATAQTPLGWRQQEWACTGHAPGRGPRGAHAQWPPPRGAHAQRPPCKASRVPAASSAGSLRGYLARGLSVPRHHQLPSPRPVSKDTAAFSAVWTVLRGLRPRVQLDQSVPFLPASLLCLCPARFPAFKGVSPL